MDPSLLTRVCSWSLASLLVAILLQPGALSAEPVAVRYREGSVHGFLALRTREGKLLAAGDLTQVIHGDRAVSHLVFRFRDGSVDDETAVFSQRGTFDSSATTTFRKARCSRSPQMSPSTPRRARSRSAIKTKIKKKWKPTTSTLPPDLANGIVLDIVKNIAPHTKETKLSYVAATPKPRVVKISITPQGEETFSVAGAHHKATRFNVKVELGGVAGMIAPLVGKQPADTNVWVAGGEAPAFVKSEGPLYVGGPVWSIEMTSPVWRQTPDSKGPKP